MNQNIDNKNEIFKHRFREGNGDELVLLISEKDQKAYLPYHYEDLENIMNRNPKKYHNIQQVIEDKYIRNCRFHETFLIHGWNLNQMPDNLMDSVRENAMRLREKNGL